ncbi:3-oxoacyl-(acyl-carrier-protein) synthase [Lewinella aquimaris]|uniref:3-oxoacyl-(Acyl-carrier-protein) synthase n=1 Tax=Neolewinella aquimaris TaxID=1835722 RepID=A0A840E7U7_9BACT|nr:beta-ketoacyl synthase N-terminal-like domain-containing protein [Neolewinella aquimaris]MBB4077869.1 3-oxoacyl-(acyl-carrier-protein) synthase [Neolewinella aquimaris]
MNIQIAGTGMISAAGNTVPTTWNTLLTENRSWQPDPATGLPVYPVGALPKTGPIAEYIHDREVDRTVALALPAAAEAVGAAKWEGRDFAILVGCSRGPTEAWETAYETHRTGQTLPVRTSPNTTLGSVGFALADYFGVGELSDGLSVACSSGFHALVHGVALLRSGMAERVLVGGTEAALTLFTLRQMERLRIVATPTPQDNYACRPMDDPATGMVVGEGAAFLALEAVTEPDGPTIQGLGFSRERCRSATGISREGMALQSSMRQAAAAVGPPDLIVAHAPGTRRGDAAEQLAIQQVFGNQSPVTTSMKWATGHTFGASGPLALVAAVEMLRKQRSILLPYAQLSEPAELHRILVNATGFGGNAVSVMIG